MRQLIQITEGKHSLMESRLSEISRYLEVRPVDLPSWHEHFDINGDEIWEAFVNHLGDEDQRRLARLLNVEDVSDTSMFDYDSLPERAKIVFADYLEEMNIPANIVYENPHGAPAWMLLDKREDLPPTTWVLHFSDHVEAIARQGFTKGEPDVDSVALTRVNDIFGNTERIEHNGPGYNFGYPVDGSIDLDLRVGGYGAGAVLFQSPGVLVYHAGDRETQIIFDGEAVQPAGMFVLLKRDD